MRVRVGCCFDQWFDLTATRWAHNPYDWWFLGRSIEMLNRVRSCGIISEKPRFPFHDILTNNYSPRCKQVRSVARSGFRGRILTRVFLHFANYLLLEQKYLCIVVVGCMVVCWSTHAGVCVLVANSRMSYELRLPLETQGWGVGAKLVVKHAHYLQCKGHHMQGTQ